MGTDSSKTKAHARIAVLIPSYNSEKTIGKTIESLNANTEPHDIVIVDDGSRRSLRDYVTAQPNLTILRISKNAGITAALNYGLRYIQDRGYDYVARLDADDTATKNRLTLQVAYMDQHPDVVLLGSSGEVVSEAGKTLYYLNHPTDHETIATRLFYNSCFFHPTFMIRTSALRSFGLYDERYPNAEDYELVRRFAVQAKVANLPDYLIRYTVSTGGQSVKKRRQQLRQRLRVQWQYRDFKNIHFYLGVLKTFILACLPMSLITTIKQHLSAYQKKQVI